MVGARNCAETGNESMWSRITYVLTRNENFEYVLLLQHFVGIFFDCIMMILGPFMVILALAIIFFVTYSYFTSLLPVLVNPESGWYILHQLWAANLFCNVCWNYGSCIFTKPGQPHTIREIRKDPSILQYESPPWVQSLFRRRLDDIKAGFCKKCNSPKPPRSHHCHVCKKCILNMDHHCPWVNNCVGYRNYKFFFLFLLWLEITCVYGFLLTVLPFFDLVETQGAGRATDIRLGLDPDTIIPLIFILSSAIGFAVGILLFWHIFLISTGQSTIEFYLNQGQRYKARARGEIWRNPYDIGFSKNWKQIFGDRSWYVAIFPSSSPPPAPLCPFYAGMEELTQLDGEYTV